MLGGSKWLTLLLFVLANWTVPELWLQQKTFFIIKLTTQLPAWCGWLSLLVAQRSRHPKQLFRDAERNFNTSSFLDETLKLRAENLVFTCQLQEWHVVLHWFLACVDGRQLAKFPFIYWFHHCVYRKAEPTWFWAKYFSLEQHVLL